VNDSSQLQAQRLDLSLPSPSSPSPQFLFFPFFRAIQNFFSFLGDWCLAIDHRSPRTQVPRRIWVPRPAAVRSSGVAVGYGFPSVSVEASEAPGFLAVGARSAVAAGWWVWCADASGSGGDKRGGGSSGRGRRRAPPAGDHMAPLQPAARAPRPSPSVSRKAPPNKGVFDFTLLASLADEPGCGQPEPGSTHSRVMFDLFSPVRHAELVFVFDMVQRWVK